MDSSSLPLATKKMLNRILTKSLTQEGMNIRDAENVL